MKPNLSGKLRSAVITPLLLLAPFAATAAAGPESSQTVFVNEQLSITGDTGSYTLKADAVNNKLGSIKTTGADIVLDNQVNGKTQSISLQEESTMDGGTLSLSFSASKAASSMTLWGGSSSDIAFKGAKLSLNNVKVVLNQTEGPDATSLSVRNSFQTYGVTLYTISNTYGSTFDWNCTLEVNAPLLDKYYTNYRLGSENYYHIDPIRPFPYPTPDYDVIMGGEEQGSIEADSQAIARPGIGDIIIIEPIYPIYPIYPRRGNIIVVADREMNYYGKKLGSKTDNGKTGMDMAGLALAYLTPQLEDSRVWYPDLAAVMDALDIHVANHNTQAADRLTAALAGASTTTLAHAAMDDMHRQLRSIRNRIASAERAASNDTERGVRDIWFNAEGDYRQLDADGTAAGYKLNSWGGTFGMDYDVNGKLFVGAAATVMFGDLTACGPESSAEGDMDIYYVSFYARYTHRSWIHTMVMSFGRTDFTLDRTVNTGMGAYSTSGSTTGKSFGFLYEVAYDFVLDKTGAGRVQPLINIAYRQVSVNGYQESGSDAALMVGRNTMNTTTIGVGARLLCQAGPRFFNREARFESRFLLKLDAGDRISTTNVALAEMPFYEPGTVHGAKADAVGMEIGAGLQILVTEHQTLFFDVSTEFRQNSPNVNGTIGYRISF